MIMNSSLFQKLNYFYNHKFVKQTVMLQVGSFGGTIVQAVIGVIIARLLQPELFGIYSLAIGMAGMISLILGVGIQETVSRGGGIQEAVSSMLGRAYARKDDVEIENILGFMLKITFL